MTPGGAILTINSGSSSLKFALFEPGKQLKALLRGEIEDLTSHPHLVAHSADGTAAADQRWAEEAPPFGTVLRAVLAVAGGARLSAVGHRIVDGGDAFTSPEIITPSLLTALEALKPLDPLHLPDNLAPVRAVAEAMPAVKQVACFDTAFHRAMPEVATLIALPRAFAALGVRRYGFHGLSYEYIATALQGAAPHLASGRTIVAHLGSGASLCAMRDGASIATTMGFSTLDGLVMATRCGTLDPGVILYLLRQGHCAADIETILYHRSGLLGVSGISGDVRVLLASDDANAGQALDLFSYRIACEAGGLIPALGGLDGLVFTAGIGERAPAIRAAVCARLAWLGLTLDHEANEANAACISAPGSQIEVRVIPTDEETTIARHTQAALAANQ